MLIDFHPGTERLAILRSEPDGGHRLELSTLEGQTLGEIPADLLPLGPHWSPDGASIAFGSNDGILYLYCLGDAGPKVLFSDPALQAGFCEWSPDGSRLVFSATNKETGAPPDIYCLAVDTGRVIQLTAAPDTVDRFPHWSPCGRWVAFQRQFLDEPDLPRRVYLVNAQSGKCFPVLDEFDGECETSRCAWSPDSSSLLVTLTRQDRVELRLVRLQDQAAVWRFDAETIQRGAFSPQGDRILCVCSDELLWFSYPEGKLLERLSLAHFASVWNYYTGAQIGFDRSAKNIYFVGADACLYRWQIGGHCEGILKDLPPEPPPFTHEAYFVTARDGQQIPVQRFIPPQPRSAAVLYVHGGPNAPINPQDLLMLHLLAEGVEFICAAYRGSAGYGREYEEANRGECGRADVWDILAVGFDWKKRTGENRPLVVAGYSYGGFLALLALAQAEIPWAGGVALWAVSDLAHMGIHQHRAFPDDELERAAARIERSPLHQSGRIRVPLLIFHGALDTAATTAEMQSIQASILSRGGECGLIVFTDDTHGLGRHRDEIHARLLDFLNRFG